MAFNTTAKFFIMSFWYAQNSFIVQNYVFFITANSVELQILGTNAIIVKMVPCYMEPGHIYPCQGLNCIMILFISPVSCFLSLRETSLEIGFSNKNLSPVRQKNALLTNQQAVSYVLNCCFCHFQEKKCSF